MPQAVSFSLQLFTALEWGQPVEPELPTPSKSLKTPSSAKKDKRSTECESCASPSSYGTARHTEYSLLGRGLQGREPCRAERLEVVPRTSRPHIADV